MGAVPARSAGIKRNGQAPGLTIPFPATFAIYFPPMVQTKVLGRHLTPIPLAEGGWGRGASMPSQMPPEQAYGSSHVLSQGIDELVCNDYLSPLPLPHEEEGEGRSPMPTSLHRTKYLDQHFYSHFPYSAVSSKLPQPCRIQRSLRLGRSALGQLVRPAAIAERSGRTACGRVDLFALPYV